MHYTSCERSEPVTICYQLIGVPGSGKSTWVANQPWARDCAYISTDVHVDAYAQSQGKTYSEVFKEYMPTAIDLMMEDVERARTAGQDVIWDQTNTTVKSRARKFRQFLDYEHIAVVFFTPKWSELKQRLDSRPGKTIPRSVVKSMIHNFEMPTESEGFKEIWHV